MLRELLSFSVLFIGFNCLGDAEQTKFTGTVEPAKSIDLAFGHFGKITSIKPIGYITNRHMAQAGSSEESIIVKGDIVARQDTSLYRNQVAIAEAEVRSAKASLEEAKNHFDRSTILEKKHAISKKALDKAARDYKNAKAALATAEATLATAIYHLDRCFLRAPFSGQIEDKYKSIGSWVGPGEKVLRITLVSLVKIKIPVPEKLLRNIGITDRILVYPPGADKPVGVWFDTLVYPSGSNEPVGKSFEDINPDRNNLYVYVANRLVPIKKLSEAQKKLPKINKIIFISRLNAASDNAPLWVPFSSLHKDKAGNYYVWKAKGQKIAQPGKSIASEFEVEKVAVTLGKEFRDFGVYKYRELKDAGKLQNLDIVLPKTNYKLKDGDRVVVEELQWLFSTGDKVDVIIPSAEKLMKSATSSVND